MIRVLIIDDDEVDRIKVRWSLICHIPGVELIECADGRSGLASFKAEPFDCVVLDYRLPDCDGLDLLSELVALPAGGDPAGPAVPVVMLTGAGNEAVAVEAMKRGAVDYLTKRSLSSPAIVRAVRVAVDRAARERLLGADTARLVQLALYDSLTGLGNRNLFGHQLDQLVARHRRNGVAFGLMLMDLDRFKEINDTLGHRAGDVALGEIGRRLRVLARGADSFFRLGGDEFAGLMVTEVSSGDAAILADRIIAAVQAPLDLGVTLRSVSVSLGLALCPDHGGTGDALLGRADAAMYFAKRRGGGYAFADAADGNAAGLIVGCAARLG